MTSAAMSNGHILHWQGGFCRVGLMRPSNIEMQRETSGERIAKGGLSGQGRRGGHAAQGSRGAGWLRPARGGVRNPRAHGGVTARRRTAVRDSEPPTLGNIFPETEGGGPRFRHGFGQAVGPVLQVVGPALFRIQLWRCVAPPTAVPRFGARSRTFRLLPDAGRQFSPIGR